MEKEIAKKLLEIKAVLLQPDDMFTWASGIKSPIYCDNRLTLSYPEIRNLVKESFAKSIKENFTDLEIIAGVATAGIPHGALVADLLGLPFVYVRSSSKDHGRQNQIEGNLPKDAKVVLIEDLISTGGSSIKAYQALQEAGANMLGLAAIFTYGFPIADEKLKEANVKVVTLSNYEALIETALENNYIKESELELLQKWRKEAFSTAPSR